MRVTTGRALGWALSLGYLAFARAAEAEPLPVELSWEAPAECPSHDEVMAELGRITRVKPGSVVASIHADAKIERGRDGQYRLRLRTQREAQSGDTDLAAANCPVLKRAVTLVLALALGEGVDLIDDKAPSDGTEPPPEHAAIPAPPVPPAPQRAPAKPPAPAYLATGAERGAWRWAPWLAAVSAWGLVGKPSLGAQFGLSAGQKHWEAQSALSVWPAQGGLGVQNVTASFSALVASAGACARAPWAASALSACAALDVGAIRGSSRGAFQDGAATAPWVALGPSLVLMTPLYGPIELRCAASLGVALDPPSFAVRSLGEVYAVARFVPALSLGLALTP